jgi:FAD/FMN-containing dehydrogenase
MPIVTNKVHHPLYAELSTIVGPTYTSDEDFVRITYSKDSSPAPAQVQGIVVRPANTEQVVQIVKLANYTRTPIVPSGGRASLYGCPPGLPGRGIVVDMTRMRKVLEIDEVRTTVTAEAGITVAELTAYCHEKGWDIHTALQPFFSDTVGGQLSGVLGGGSGLELSSAGWNEHHICGMKVVLPDGSVLQTGGGPGTNINQKSTFAREPGGPSITGMFVGDAGVFGIKVEATYRMYRLCKMVNGRACVFDTLDEAWRFCSLISTVEPLPYTTIAMIPPTKTTVMMGAPNKHLVIVIIKGNSEEEIAPKLNIVAEVLGQTKGQFSDHPGAQDWVEQAASGKRHREMGLFGSLGVWTYLELVTPRDEVTECVRWIREFHQGTLERHNIPYEVNNGVVAVGSNQWIITSIIFLKGWDAKAMAIMYDLWRDGLKMGVARGWFPDANQGWGSIAQAKYWSAPMTTFMRTIKKALDPNNIMNPGLWGL